MERIQWVRLGADLIGAAQALNTVPQSGCAAEVWDHSAMEGVGRSLKTERTA
jgi:hypothetical protein